MICQSYMLSTKKQFLDTVVYCKKLFSKFPFVLFITQFHRPIARASSIYQSPDKVGKRQATIDFGPRISEKQNIQIRKTESSKRKRERERETEKERKKVKKHTETERKKEREREAQGFCSRCQSKTKRK